MQNYFLVIGISDMNLLVLSFAQIFFLISRLINISAEEFPLSSYSLPVVKYADLLSLDENVAADIADKLTSLGAIQIVGIPRFNLFRKRALEDLAECMINEDTVASTQMNDGSRRLSCAAKSTKGIAQPMSSVCGEGATRLRAVVDATTRQLFLSLDAIATKKNKDRKLLMKPRYYTFNELFGEGEHLEHLHTYFSPSQNTPKKDTEMTLDFHVDAGMLIAMTTGYYSHEKSDKSGLYIMLPDNTKAKAIVDDNALVIMVGDGASRWLSPLLGKPLRAIPHALIADLQPVQGTAAARSWYGKMYLPPADAIIPQEDLTFREYHILESKHSQTSGNKNEESRQSLSDLLPSACGGKLSHYKSTVQDNCAADEIFCWAQCMSLSEISCDKSDAICYNYRDETPSDPSSMCMQGDDDVHNGHYCRPACSSILNNDTDYSSGYCRGEGTTMFMQGFISIVEKGDGKTDCVNLLFPQWTLDSELKYAFACIGVFGMSMLIQFLAKLRVDINKKYPNTIYRKLAHTILYGMHVILGYFAMLVAMTYSVELFCMICCGLIVGFAVFHSDDPLAHKTSDPCCGETETSFNGEHPEDCPYSPLNDEEKQAKNRLNSLVSDNVEEHNCCGAANDQEA